MLDRLNRFLIVAAMLFAFAGVKADDFCSLTVKEQCGTWTSYALTNLKLTFGTSNMTLSNQEQTVVYPISELKSMEFTDFPTAIQNAAASYTVVSLQGSQIRINAKVGTMAKVYDTMGRLYATARIGQQSTPVFIGNLEPGIYVVKAGEEKCKVLVK